MSLSDKRICSIAGDELPKYEWDVIQTEDVKEFIKEVIKIVGSQAESIEGVRAYYKIKELAGPRLVEA